LRKSSAKDKYEESYLKKTINVKEPIKCEVDLCKASTIENGQSYDLMNFPNALPEEIFVFFGN